MRIRLGHADEGEAIRVSGIPFLRRNCLQGVRAGDPMKSKHLEKALCQFAEEGAESVQARQRVRFVVGRCSGNCSSSARQPD